MTGEKYYDIGYKHATVDKLNYWEASRKLGEDYPETKTQLLKACSWEDGWNDGNKHMYNSQMEKDMNVLKEKLKLTPEDLDVLKRFFTDDVKKEIKHIRRCM